jgi:hypothetical protein
MGKQKLTAVKPATLPMPFLQGLPPHPAPTPSSGGKDGRKKKRGYQPLPRVPRWGQMEPDAVVYWGDWIIVIRQTKWSWLATAVADGFKNVYGSLPRQTPDPIVATAVETIDQIETHLRMGWRMREDEQSEI